MFLILKVYTCLGLLSNLEIQFNTISWKNYGVELGSYIVLWCLQQIQTTAAISKIKLFKLFVLVDFLKRCLNLNIKFITLDYNRNSNLD